jgi:hypothetical protein
LNNVLASRLEAESDISPELQLTILKSSLQLPDDLTPTQMATIMKAYADGIRGIFIMFVPLGALSLLLSLFVLDVGLPDDKPQEESRNSETEEDEARDVDPSAAIEDVPQTLPAGEKIVSTGLDETKTRQDKR